MWYLSKELHVICRIRWKFVVKQWFSLRLCRPALTIYFRFANEHHSLSKRSFVIYLYMYNSVIIEIYIFVTCNMYESLHLWKQNIKVYNAQKLRMFIIHLTSLLVTSSNVTCFHSIHNICSLTRHIKSLAFLTNSFPRIRKWYSEGGVKRIESRVFMSSARPHYFLLPKRIHL